MKHTIRVCKHATIDKTLDFDTNSIIYREICNKKDSCVNTRCFCDCHDRCPCYKSIEILLFDDLMTTWPLNAIVKRNGKAQVNKCIEECSELIKALANWYADKPDYDNIAEEIADVEIMCEQMRIFFGNSVAVDEQRARKMERIKGLLNES